jgi:putative ATP-binding cassette transporter
MSLFSLLAKRAPRRVLLSVILGIASGVASALLIPLIMVSLDGAAGLQRVSLAGKSLSGIETTHSLTAAVFVAVLLFIWASRTGVDIMMTRVAMAAAADLRCQMYFRIVRAPLAAMEKIGLSRLVTAIATDMPAIVTGAQTAQSLLTDMVTLLGMLSFLATVHVEAFWFVLKCMVFGVLSFRVMLVFAQRHFIRAARVNDTLQRCVHGLIHGFKELKLSDEKRREYFNTVLLATESELSAAQRPGSTIHSAAANYGLMLNFLILGATAFIFARYHPMSAQSLSSIIMVMLYISVPIGSVMTKIPQFTLARVAIGRVDELLAELPQESVAQESGQVRAWRSVRFENVVYQHQDKGGEGGFAVGPISLEFRKAEITFIVGGNGSGKSTLSKLLSLHYHATEGAIYFDEVRLTGENMNSYRQSISAIYSDYYLFDRILVATRDKDRVEHYLKELGLDKKVNYQDGRFSTLSLSDGQRRRMALVAVFMDDRDLYLFDEWAADQDPGFKEIFYREILPSLRARGKAVVVISHDDRYFDVADKLIVMCEGKVQSTHNAGKLAKQSA